MERPLMVERAPAAFLERPSLGRYFSSIKILRALRRIPGLFQNLQWHCRFLSFLLRHPATRTLLLQQPVLPFKHLSHDYLSIGGIGPTARSTALFHNYEFLHSIYNEDFLTDVFSTGVLLSRIEGAHELYTIDLKASGPCYEEGELSLFFRAANVEIYCISFSFVPGNILRLDAPTVILVTRIQGGTGCYPVIQAAMKTLDNLSLPMVLFALLEGIAEASNVRDLAGVSASNLEAMKGEPVVPSLHKTYEAFFQTLGSHKEGSGFYHIGLPFVEKPLSDISPSNRLRSKSQRKLKNELRGQSYRHLSQHRRASRISQA